MERCSLTGVSEHLMTLICVARRRSVIEYLDSADKNLFLARNDADILVFELLSSHNP